MSTWQVTVAIVIGTSCSGTPQPSQPRPSAPAGSAAAVHAPVCGRRSTEQVIAQTSPFTYDASCNQRETTWANVPHEHRTCTSDADCVVVLHNANCDAFPLAKSAEKHPDYARGPCGNPAQGFCAGASHAAKCIEGCCNLTREMDRWGTREVAYPDRAR